MSKRDGKRAVAAEVREAAVRDIERAFIAEGTIALARIALTMAGGAPQPHGWAHLLLTLAAEKVAHDAEAFVGPEEVTRIRKRAQHEAHEFRYIAAQLTEQRAEGAEVVAQALAGGDAAAAESA